MEHALTGHRGGHDFVERRVLAEHEAGERDGQRGGAAEAGACRQAGGAVQRPAGERALAVGQHLEAGAYDGMIAVGPQLERQLPLRDDQRDRELGALARGGAQAQAPGRPAATAGWP